MAGAQPYFDVRMGFEQDDRVWIGGAGSLYQIQIGGDVACAGFDRGVIFDLTGNKNTVAFGQVGGSAAEIVFSNAKGSDADA